MIGILGIEFKRILFYRGDLIVRIVSAALVRIVLGYYLWAAVFAANGGQPVNGLSFDAVMMYYVIAALTANAVMIPVGVISREVYDGGLTKYLVYPISYLYFRAGTTLANCSVGIVQLLCGLLFWRLFHGTGGFDTITVASLLLGLISILCASLLYFSLLACVELLSLWVEQAHTLSLTVVFLVNLMGGIFVPISVFPLWAQAFLSWTPFPYLIFYPSEVIRGSVATWSVVGVWALTLVWSFVFILGAKILWQRGSYRYSGVGM